MAHCNIALAQARTPFPLHVMIRSERTLRVQRTIRRVTSPEHQQAETYRYWQSLPVGVRLSAVWDVSAAAYAFAAAFKGTSLNDARRPQRTITRIQRSRS